MAVNPMPANQTPVNPSFRPHSPAQNPPAPPASASAATIRARTIVSAGAQLLSAAPSIPRRGRRVSEAAPDRGQIEIHTDVWIGHNAVVMPGTIIHPDAVVQPGCVVKKLVSARIVIGNLTHHQHNRDLV